MDLNKTYDKLCKDGVKIPLLQNKGRPDFIFTMTFLSFNTALLGQIGKIVTWLNGIDPEQSKWLFALCLASYVGDKKLNKSTNESKTEVKE